MVAPAFRFLFAGMLVVACGGGKDAKPGAATDEPTPVVAPSVAVYYDGEQVATVTAEALAERTSLMDVVDEQYRDRTAWDAVDARTADGRRLAIPAVKYADHDPALYIGDDGAPAFGWFAETTADDEKQSRLSLVRVAEIHITTAAAASDLDRSGGIAVAVNGAAPVPVLASQIRALPVHRKGERGASKKSKIRGRSLRALIGLATDVDKVATVTVRVGDATQVFSAVDLAVDGGENVLFRRDRRGNLIVRWLLETGQRGEFRNVELFEVALAK